MCTGVSNFGTVWGREQFGNGAIFVSFLTDLIKKDTSHDVSFFVVNYYLLASSIATAQATLIPTIGLLPIRGSKFLL